MADWDPSHWNPIKSDFRNNPRDAALAGLSLLAVFAAIEVGIFFGFGATVAEIGTGVVINGIRYYGLTVAEEAVLRAALVRTAQGIIGLTEYELSLLTRALYSQVSPNLFNMIIRTTATYNFTINASAASAFMQYMNELGFDCYMMPGPDGERIYCVL